VTDISAEGAIELDRHITFQPGKAHVSLGYATTAAPGATIPTVDDLYISSSPLAMRKLGGWSALKGLVDSAKEMVSIFSDDIEAFESVIVETAPIQPPKLPTTLPESDLENASLLSPSAKTRKPNMESTSRTRSRRSIPSPNPGATVGSPTR
jgi:hypothetical protein